MGKYHNNASELPSIGRELRPLSGYQTQIETLQSMLRPGEILVGYYDKAWRKIAPVLNSQSDIDNFYRQYESGEFVAMGYYALPEDKLRIE